MKSIRKAAVIMLFALVCVIPAFSQVTNTGTITGKAVDSSSAVIPGVEVTITSPQMIGGSRSAPTDESGTYRFTQLVAGTYRVSFALPGFRTLNIDGVNVTASATMTINGTMQVSSVAEEVTVTSETPAIDLQAATVGVNFEKSKLDDLPWGRSVVSLAQMVPGIYVTNYDVGGNQMGGSSNIGGRVYGRSGGEVRTYDGVAWCMGFDDYGAYEEIQLTAAAKGAEAMSPGILATYVVKSGGNQFHGTAQTSWEDGSFQSNNVDSELLAKGFSSGSNNFTRYNQFNVDVGGPILHNKLWFYGSYDYDYSGQNIAGFGSLGSTGPAVYPVFLKIPTIKLSYQLNSSMKLESMVQVSQKNAPYRTGSALVPLEATQNQKSTTALGPTIKWTWIMSPKMTAEMGLERGGYWWPTLPHTDAPRVMDLTSGQIRGGYLNNYLRPIRWQWNGSWSWFTDLAGKPNEIKTGFIGWWDKQFASNTGYPYQELFEYQSTAADTAGCTGYTCNYFSRPAQVVTYDYPNYTASIVNYAAWYFNDQINLSKKLTVNLGVRYDHYSDYLPAQGNPGTGPFAQGESLYPAVSDFPTYHKLVPRISFTYDVRGDGRVALKASYSQYAGGGSAPGSAPGVTGRSVNRAGTITKTYTGWDGKFPYVPNPANLVAVSGGGGIQAIAPDLTTPYTNQYTAGVQVGWKRDYLVGFTAVRTFDFGGSNLLNLSLPYSAYTDVRCIPDPGRTNIGFTSKATVAGPLDTGENPTGNQVCAWSVPKTYPTFKVVNNLYANYASNEGTKNYTAFETTFQKQNSNGWSALIGYTVDFAHINTADQTKFNPNSLTYNWEEPQWNQSVKMNGTYDVPWHGIKYSSTYQIQTGQYYGRFVNVRDANGSNQKVQVEQHAGRYPAVKLWSNRFAKVFKIGDRQTLEAMFDLDNTLNANTVLQVITTNSNTFLEPLASNGSSTSATPIIPARIFKLGVRYRF